MILLNTRAQAVGNVTFHNTTSTYTYDMSGNDTTFSSRADTDKGRLIEPMAFYADPASNISSPNAKDWVGVGDYNGGTNNYLIFGANNDAVDKGDYIRVLVKPSTNSAPTASDKTVYINENNTSVTYGERTPLNTTKVFAASDFNFSDTDGDSLSKVKITTLESAGTLEYSDGSSWSDVTEDQEITAANITSGYLRFTPALNSEDDVTFSFKVHDGTEYSSSAYDMNISVNAAPYVTNVTHSGNVAAGATTSSADIHGVINGTDAVADSDDDDSVLVVTGVAAGNESTNSTIITDDTGVGSGVAGTYGTLTVAADGTYTYTASATNNIAYNSTAADTFTFTTRDDEGSSGNAGSHAYDVGTITFTVASSISLTNDNDTATEGTPITVTGAQDDVLNNDTADTDGLVVTNISHDNGTESVSSGTTYANGASLTGDYGTLVIGADGSYTFTPNDVLGASETGTDVFTYTADGATATLSIEVTGINDAPTALDNSITTNEDTNHVFSTGEFNFSDDDNSGSLNKIKITSLEDNGALQYYNGSTWVDVTENQEITAADITSGYLRFKPDANENGNSYTSFEFQVSDGTAYSSSSSTMTINVTPVNDAPVSSASSVTTNEDTTYTFAADDFSFTDEEGDTLSSVTVSALSGSDGTFLLNGAAITDSTTVSKADIDAGLLTFVPDANENGSDYNTFTFTVNDGNDDSGSSTMTVNVTPVNDAPTSSNATININENNQESSAGDRTPSNITYTFSSSDFAFSDTDSGEAITHVKIVSLPTRGDLSYNSSNITTTDYEIAIGDIGNLVYTPDANSETDDSFTFTVSDGTVYSSTPNTITVLVNAAPNVTDVTRSGAVAAGTQTSAGDIRRVINSIDVVADSDDDDSVLVVTGVAAGNESTNSTIITDDTGVGSGVAGTYGSLTVTANGTYGYSAYSTNRLAYGATATDTFTFTIRDDETASGSSAYDVGTITFTVGASISLANDDDTATEGTPITVTGAQDDVLNDDTRDWDGLVVTNISHDNGTESVSSGTTYANGASLTGDYGTLVIGADGSYTFTPNDVLGASETGTDVFTYTADGATATLTITVTGINDAPTALDNSITTNEDTNHVFSTGEFNFSDDDNSGSLNKIKITSLEDNGALQYYNGSTWVDVTENQEITAADITSGYLRFKPDANENGNSYTSFEFQVSDGTAYSSSSSTMTINVTPVNDAPVAANNTGTILEDGTLTVNDGDGANSSGGVTDDDQTADISNEETSVSGLSFNNDGTKMFVSGGQSDTVHEYSLSTAFDVSTKSATANESYSDASNYDWTRGHTWNADGTKLFIIDNDEGESWQKILEHTVQTAFDLSSTVTRTNTYDLVAPSGGSIPTRPKGITFNSDGTKMYIADHATDKIHQFTLSVGFDLTSTVVNSGTLDVSSQNDSPYGVEFSQDGSKVFVVGNGTQGDAVYQYTLNTAWDITSTATYNDSFNLSSQDSVPADIRFNNDGTKMFIAGSNGNEIDEYTLSTPFEIASISGDHDGDVLVDDTDADSGDTLTVTTYSHTSATDEDGGSISSTSSTGTAGTNNVTGYYGTLDLEGDGSYTYTADLTATQALDPGDTVTDVFTYTVDDGNGETDTATITITVIGVNDTPVAQNDVGVIVEDGTLTVANSANANLSGSYDATGEHSGDVIDTSSSSHTDSDADASASLTVTAIRVGSSEGSGTAGSIGSALTGTYGQLTIAADGSYSYVANQDLADALDVGDSVTDTFNYTLSDGTATDIGVITITILGANDNPTAVNDTGYIKEGGTLTVANSAAANSGTSTGNHTGDMTDNDTDADASSTATITSITAALGDAQTTFSSNSETVTGAYGTLTINSNGSYSYVADSNISGLDAEDANVTDVFTYIVSDGTATSAATLTINVIASQDLTAQK